MSSVTSFNLHHPEEGGCIFILILQMRTLRPRAVRRLVQSHAGTSQQSQDWSPSSSQPVRCLSHDTTQLASPLHSLSKCLLMLPITGDAQMNKTECLTLSSEPSGEADKGIHNPRHVINAIIMKLTKCCVSPQNSDTLCPHAGE